MRFADFLRHNFGKKDRFFFKKAALQRCRGVGVKSRASTPSAWGQKAARQRRRRGGKKPRVNTVGVGVKSLTSKPSAWG